MKPTSHIESLCQEYEHYRRIGLSVHAADTLATIESESYLIKEDVYEHLRTKYIHVFSHLPPREIAHICYEGNK